MPVQPGLQQDELTIARYDEIDHLRVAIAGVEPFAHEQTQIARQRCLGIVDRLVLADHAAQFARDLAGASLERGIRKYLVYLDRMQRRRTEKHEHYQKKPNAPGYSAS